MLFHFGIDLAQVKLILPARSPSTHALRGGSGKHSLTEQASRAKRLGITGARFATRSLTFEVVTTVKV